VHTDFEKLEGTLVTLDLSSQVVSMTWEVGMNEIFIILGCEIPPCKTRTNAAHMSPLSLA